MQQQQFVLITVTGTPRAGTGVIQDFQVHDDLRVARDSFWSAGSNLGRDSFVLIGRLFSSTFIHHRPTSSGAVAGAIDVEAEKNQRRALLMSGRH